MLKAIFGLARKAAVTDNSLARNLLHHALKWRDDEDWHFHNVMLFEIDPYNSEHWRHRTRGRRRWQWDGILVFAFGRSWREVVTAKTVPFKQLLKSFIDKTFEWTKVQPPSITRDLVSRKGPGDQAIPISLEDVFHVLSLLNLSEYGNTKQNAPGLK